MFIMHVRVQLVFLTIIGSSFTESGNQCITPEGKRGSCVSLFACEAVFKALSSKNTTIRNFAKQSLCGHTNETQVCCELHSAVKLNDFEETALPDRKTCGVVRETDRIAGATISAIDEFPWVVGIEYKSKISPENNGEIKCSGSLISKKYVLTTANCLVNKKYKPVSVWLGDWRISTDPDCTGLPTNLECADPVQKYSIREVIPHLLYSRKYQSHNIGLIRLKIDVEFNDFIRPICLPSSNEKPPEVGSHLTAAGWVNKNNGTITDYKIKAELLLLQNEVCNEKYNNTIYSISTNHICVGGEDRRDTCLGDSGVPLMKFYQDKSTQEIQWYQEGIASWGLRCDRLGHLALYIRVSDYMRWITNVISKV